MALLLLAGCGAQSEESTYRQIHAEEAATLMEKESSYIILDVRTAEEYSEYHIEGSTNIPLGNLDSIVQFITDKSTPLFVHCLSGGRSARAVAFLKSKGYTDVHDIGGISAYRGETV